MSKTAKVEARVLPLRHERYAKAAGVLRIDEMSDYVRRACDELADKVLGANPPAKTKARQSSTAGGREELSDGRRVRR